MGWKNCLLEGGSLPSGHRSFQHIQALSITMIRGCARCWIQTSWRQRKTYESFVVSFVIAAFLGFRWLGAQRILKKKHRLDEHIRSLLEIEKQQIGLGYQPEIDHVPLLQSLSEKVTELRQEALRELSAYQLTEDRATDTFIMMCHSLTDKINSKMTRHTLDRRFQQLLDRTTDDRKPSTPHPAPENPPLGPRQVP